MELFISREAILHAREVPQPVVGGARIAYEFQMEVVRQISISVLEGLREDLASLPSTSSGFIDATMVMVVVERAMSEFHRRVEELFGTF